MVSVIVQYSIVDAVLTSFSALSRQIHSASTDKLLTSEDRAKAEGMHKKLGSSRWTSTDDSEVVWPGIQLPNKRIQVKTVAAKTVG